MPRALTRVYLPDGLYKTIVVESDQTVKDIIPVVAEKFQATSTENFSNCVLFESLDNEKVINELPLTTKPYYITTEWKPESNNRLIFKSRNQSVLVHDTGFVPPPSTTVLPDAPKNSTTSSYNTPAQHPAPIPPKRLPTGAQPLFSPGAAPVTSNNTIRKRSPSDANSGPTQSYQPVNAPTGNTAELQERLNKMKAAEQERRIQDTVQQQSILVWCNYHLRSQNVEITNTVADFADGVNFALLIQSLTSQPIKINQNPRTYQEKMENLRGAFNVLEGLGAKPKGCSPEDFVNGNANAITGLLLLLVGKFKDVSKRASSRFSTILTSQGAAVTSAPARPPPQRPPRPPGTQTLSRPGAPINTPPPSNPMLSTSPPSRLQPPIRAVSEPDTQTTTIAPSKAPPAQPPSRPPVKSTAASAPPATAQPPPQRPTRPQPPVRSSLDPEATSTPTKPSVPPPVAPRANTMRDRSQSGADTTPAPTPTPAPAPKATTTPTKTASAPPAPQSTGKSPFTQPLPSKTEPAPVPVKRAPAPAPAKPKQTTEPPQPAPAPTPIKPPPPQEDEFALGELDKMMDTIQNTASFISPPPSKEPEPASKPSTVSPPSSSSKYPTLDDDDLGEITILADSLSEVTTAPPSGNLPVRKLSSATIPPPVTPVAVAAPPPLKPSASQEEETHFEDFDELESFLADLANELGVTLGEMDNTKPKNSNELGNLDLNFDI